MKKIFFTLAVVFSMAIPAVADSYLYWMTDMTDGRYSTEGYYDTIKIIAKTGDDTYDVLKFYAGDFSADPMMSLDYEQVNAAPGMAISGYYADLSELTGLTDSTTFYIELLKDNASVAISDSISYSEAANKNYVQDVVGGYFKPTAVPWTMAAPEPTSGLLMLLGMAALGLKRRKMTNA